MALTRRTKKKGCRCEGERLRREKGESLGKGVKWEGKKGKEGEQKSQLEVQKERKLDKEEDGETRKKGQE